MQSIRKIKKVVGSDLVLEEPCRGNGYYELKWETISIATVSRTEEGYVLEPDLYISQVTGDKYSDLSGTFKNMDKVLQYVISYITLSPEFQRFVIQQHIKLGEEYLVYKQNEEAEKVMFHHLELEELTADQNLYNCDILSKRTRNILKSAGLFTLKDISQIKRKDFLGYRNCGKQTTDEIEDLLHRVGLDWFTPPPSPPTQVELLVNIPDEILVAECKKRNIRIYDD